MIEPIWKQADFLQNDQKAIRELIKRKQKLKKLENTRDFSLRVFSIIGILTALTLLVIINFKIGSFNIWAVFDITLGNIFFIILLIAIGFFYSNWITNKKEAKEEKEKYHTLRKEIVDKTNDQWIKMYGQKNVLLLIEYLKAKYDIEISYKG